MFPSSFLRPSFPVSSNSACSNSLTSTFPNFPPSPRFSATVIPPLGSSHRDSKPPTVSSREIIANHPGKYVSSVPPVSTFLPFFSPSFFFPVEESVRRFPGFLLPVKLDFPRIIRGPAGTRNEPRRGKAPLCFRFYLTQPVGPRSVLSLPFPCFVSVAAPRMAH